MNRLFDVLLAGMGLFFGWPVLAVLWLVGLFEFGSPIYVQKRVGRFQRPFSMVKLRTMKPGTASVATHLVDTTAITRWGAFLRRTKLDELPQLWNVLKGDMSLVGPRPCLFNQPELIAEREKRGVFSVRPGVTGLAQVNDINMSQPQRLAKVDALMVKTLTPRNYFGYLFLTFAAVANVQRRSRRRNAARPDLKGPPTLKVSPSIQPRQHQQRVDAHVEPVHSR